MPFGRHPLKMVCLPISPLPHGGEPYKYSKDNVQREPAVVAPNVARFFPGLKAKSNMAQTMRRPYGTPARSWFRVPHAEARG